MHTPGHTPGHLAFYLKNWRILFLGDYDLTSFGPWYGDVYSSIEETVSSLDFLYTIPVKMWLTSHGTGIFKEKPAEEWQHYLKVIDTREQKLLDVLVTPRTLDEIAASWIVYGKPKEPREFYLFGERAIMGKHLNKLACQGIVAQIGHRYHKL